MKIVYGVSGEGSGHSSRAREMMTHLLSRGHEVKAVSYDRGFANLKDDFEVFETEGLHIRTEDNRVQVVQTFVDNLVRLGDGFLKARELRSRLFHDFQPDLVITDFEPMTAYLARHYGIPLVSLDNQHRMRYVDRAPPPNMKRDAMLTKTVIRAMVPSPDVALVTTFFVGPVTNERTFLFPPILRREVLELEPETGDHVLVYFTHGFDSFLQTLPSCSRERFVVYGSGRTGEDRNLRFEEPSRDGFLEHLRTARAVISTAGFTLMSEALHLHKPMLSLPMKGQYEQELNAHLLEESGCGRNGREARNDTAAAFLYHLPDFQAALAEYPSSDNTALQEKLDELLADDARLAKQHRDQR